MKKPFYILIVGLITLILTSTAQTSVNLNEKKAGLQTGISANQLQESSLSKVFHQGPGFYGGWFTEKVKTRSFRRFDILLEANLLKSDYETEISSFHFNLPVKYRYLYNLRNNKSGPDIYFGGFASFDANIEYFDNWDQNHYYWITSYNLGADFRTELFPSPKGKLQLEGNIPLISLISRSPEHFTNTQANSAFFDVLKTIHKNSAIAFPNRNLSFGFLVRYVFLNERKIKPAMVWKLQYLKNSFPEAGRLKIMNQSIGIEFCF